MSWAQSAVDAYRLSQPDLKGTARFMSMGGAFGALGGDLSTLSQNPAGIGVYRSNEIGFTVDLDCQNASSNGTSIDQTKFLLNNIGGVATMRLPSRTMPNLNIGFTYNKASSFNRRYGGGIRNLQTSMSNYIAGISNSNNLTVADVSTTTSYDPYNPNDGGIASPWLSVIGYDSYLVDPAGDPDRPNWQGQFGSGTSGNGYFDVIEKGSIDEYNIAIGGNIANTVYWGMNFDIINIDYNIDATWGENLQGAYIFNDYSRQVVQHDNPWNIRNLYRANGTGFNYQLGVIVKPVQEFRIGFAFHTPTWYKLTETYSAGANYNYFDRNNGNFVNGTNYTNNGTPGYNYVNFKSPWKIIASLAGVIGNRFIISADYEWAGYNKMSYSVSGNSYWYDDWYDDWDYGWGDYWPAPAKKEAPAAPATRAGYDDTNHDITNVYRNTNTLRVGAEFRVTPNFSVRAGYSFVSSPVKVEARDNKETIYTSGTLASYRFDDTTNYVTCGLGYRYRGFYIDLAYVYKHMNSVYHAYTPDPSNNLSPQSDVKFNQSQIVMSMGFRF